MIFLHFQHYFSQTYGWGFGFSLVKFVLYNSKTHSGPLPGTLFFLSCSLSLSLGHWCFLSNMMFLNAHAHTHSHKLENISLLFFHNFTSFLNFWGSLWPTKTLTRTHTHRLTLKVSLTHSLIDWLTHVSTKLTLPQITHVKKEPEKKTRKTFFHRIGIPNSFKSKISSPRWKRLTKFPLTRCIVAAL